MAAIQVWYDALPRPKTAGSAAYKGPICIGLVVLERLKTDFTLAVDSHLTRGGARIRGQSGNTVRKILASHGETRPFGSEVAGRTTPNARGYAEKLLQAIRSAGLDTLNEGERRAALHELQEFFVEKVREFHKRKRLKPSKAHEFHKRKRLKPIYDPARSTRQFIGNLLALAEKMGKRGPVAQYLVGAKLQLRFPDVDLRKESYSAADDPSGQPGDFVVEDTTFHVTVTPTPGHFEKCKRNLQDGRRVFLLVPDSVLAGARQNAELTAPGRIAVESIESFIANFIELKARFSAVAVEAILSQMCEHFNALVAKWDPEEWLTLEIVNISDSPVFATVIRES